MNFLLTEIIFLIVLKKNLAHLISAVYTQKKGNCSEPSSYKKGEFDMTYTYMTKGTCSSKIELELEGNIVHNVKFTGGCHGNLQAIPKLVEGLTVEQIEEKISGISCNGRGTSCGDQLARAARAALEASKNQ